MLVFACVVPVSEAALACSSLELQKAMTAHPDQAEGLLRVVCARAMSSGQSLEAVRTLAHLAGTLAGRKKGAQRPPSECYQGLICDWLQILCPEVVSTPEGLDVLTNMLFAVREGEGEGLSGRTLLLSQLVYSSSWDAIHQQLHQLLTEERSKTLNPTAVMDFIWACLNRPHLWRGVALKEGVVDTLLSVVSLVQGTYNIQVVLSLMLARPGVQCWPALVCRG